jgi:hypothetical protein
MEYKPFLFKDENAHFLIPDKNKIEAFYIPVIGIMRKVYFNKKDLSAMQGLVQGDVEPVNLGKFLMWCCEDGRLREFPLNFRASRINASRFGPKPDGKLEKPYFHLGIVGNVFITSMTKGGSPCSYHQTAFGSLIRAAKKVEVMHFHYDQGYEDIIQIDKDMSTFYPSELWWKLPTEGGIVL